MVDSNKLASLGLALQYDFKNQFSHLTGVELAAEIRKAIERNVLYFGHNGTELVSSHVRTNLTNAEAVDLLYGFEELDHDRWPWLAVPWITLTIVGGLFVIMRLFTRIKYCGGLRRDDYFLILAYLCSLGNNTEDIWLALEANWPAHIWDKTLEEARLHRLWGLMDGYWWFSGKGFVMMSLLIFYHDLYPGRNFRIACWIMMALTIAWTIGGLLLAQLPCKPYDSWNYLHVFECIEGYMEIASAHTIFNIILDCCVLLLPVHIIRKIKASKKDKIALGILFGLGFLVVIMAILRRESFAYYDRSKDLSWRAIPVTTWCCVELQTAIICASIPATRKLFTSMGSRISSIASNVTKSRNGGANSTSHSDSNEQPSSSPSNLGGDVQEKAQRKGFWTMLASKADRDQDESYTEISSVRDIVSTKDFHIDVQDIPNPRLTPFFDDERFRNYKNDLEMGLSSPK